MSNRILLAAFLVLLSACSRDPDIINRPPVSVIQSTDGVDRILLDGSFSSDPEGSKLTFKWSTTSSQISIVNSGYASAFFKIPPGATESELEITLKVNDGKTDNILTQSIPVPPLTEVRAYGLGKSLTKEVNNTAAYEWYLDQGNTGPFSLVNCGPTSVTMAIKWAHEDFTGTPVEARETYHSTGGWWYTNDIINYLNSHQVTNRTISLADMKDLSDEIDLGNIVILCLDMYRVTNGTDAEYRRDKFYATGNSGWGHFIVIKGYKIVDGMTFFEVHDPYSFDVRYQDQSIKGKNRYYRSQDLNTATDVWWDYAIVISKDGAIGGRKGVNTGSIVHMPGR